MNELIKKDCLRKLFVFFLFGNQPIELLSMIGDLIDYFIRVNDILYDDRI